MTSNGENTQKTKVKDKHYVYEETKTTKFLQRILKFICWCGAPNFWFEDLDVPPIIQKIQLYYLKFLRFLVAFSILFQLGSFGTQHELSDKQKSDIPLFIASFVMFYSFMASVTYRKDNMRHVMFKMMVEMKEIHNDNEVEEHFIQDCLFYIKLHMTTWTGVILMFGLDALTQTLMTGSTFFTMPTAWPDVIDYSVIASVARVIIYLMFVVEMMWFSSVYTLAIPVTSGLSHQYMNLGKYFESLNGIFNGAADQRVKEIEYEKALKVGIKCHIDMLWCNKTVQDIFSILNGGQMFHTTLALVLMMYQFTQTEHTVAMVIQLVVTTGSLLTTTGCLMWKAGDVTYAAADLPTAIFSSGWQNCSRGASRKVRPLIVISMAVAQIPVELKAFGLVSFSYDSYVSIVKSSYSVFSVLY